MPIYEALAHVLWELPFPLRLPPEIIPVWEPEEQIALFDPRPEVGEIVWRRTSTLLDRASVVPDAGPANNWYPEYDYRLFAHYPPPNGRTLKRRSTRGKEGGFIEPRQYAVVNVILCLRNKADGSVTNRYTSKMLLTTEAARRITVSVARWRQTLYRLRNEIAHEGRREVSFDEAKEALVAGMHAMHAIQDLAPDFNRALAWGGDVLDLPHVVESRGQVGRLFES